MTAKQIARECLSELNVMLKQRDYDRTLAYDIFYASYLNLRLGDPVMARVLLARFHETGVDIKHFSMAVQKHYEDVKLLLSKNLP